MTNSERNTRALLMALSAIGTVAILTLVLAVLEVIPRTLYIGLASYDIIWLCVAAIVLEMAISTPIQLIVRAQRKAARSKGTQRSGRDDDG